MNTHRRAELHEAVAQFGRPSYNRNSEGRVTRGPDFCPDFCFANGYRGTRVTRPSETRPAESGTRVTRPSETRPAESGTRITRPSETRPSEVGSGAGDVPQFFFRWVATGWSRGAEMREQDCEDLPAGLG